MKPRKQILTEWLSDGHSPNRAIKIKFNSPNFQIFIKLWFHAKLAFHLHKCKGCLIIYLSFEDSSSSCRSLDVTSGFVWGAIYPSSSSPGGNGSRLFWFAFVVKSSTYVLHGRSFPSNTFLEGSPFSVSKTDCLLAEFLRRRLKCNHNNSIYICVRRAYHFLSDSHNNNNSHSHNNNNVMIF